MKALFSKPPLVLLHGWGVNSQIWRPLLPTLQESFELFVLDLPGYGNDPTFIGEYTSDNVVDRILSNAPPRAHWLAWSLGATIAMQAALREPERFLTLQLVSATPRFIADADWKFGMKEKPLIDLADLFDTSYEKGLKKFLLLQSTNQDNARDLVRSRLDAILKLPAPSMDTLQGSLKLLTNTDLRNRIDNLQVDTRIVAGQRDQVVSPLASQWLGDTIPDAELVMLDTGHLPFLDEKDHFLENCLSFAGATTG